MNPSSLVPEPLIQPTILLLNSVTVIETWSLNKLPLVQCHTTSFHFWSWWTNFSQTNTFCQKHLEKLDETVKQKATKK